MLLYGEHSSSTSLSLEHPSLLIVSILIMVNVPVPTPSPSTIAVLMAAIRLDIIINNMLLYQSKVDLPLAPKQIM